MTPKLTLSRCNQSPRLDSSDDSAFTSPHLNPGHALGQPSRGTKVPAGPDWIHEIKHDGYRLIVQLEGKRVRLFTRNGRCHATRC